MNLHQTATASEETSTIPGVAVGVLLVIAAILWFSPGARYKFKKLTLWCVVIAIAAVIMSGYVRPHLTGGGA